ncbi:MAG: hypothetical protein SFY56_14395 [Bacteroidota bacterium]|nr:hypothetical protein [Bacteroidota bacterium]
MKSLTQLNIGFNKLKQVQEKINNFTAQKLGPTVFNFGSKEKAWGLSTNDLLKFPEGSLGLALGEFLKKNRLEPIARAESHDVYHVLFDYSISFKDEIGLQFFLRGNGKNSLASFATSIGAWCILPGQWSYLRDSYRRGKKCVDITLLNPKALLYEDYHKIKLSLYKY